MATEDTMGVAHGNTLDLTDIAQKMMLFNKLAQLKEEIFSGRHPTLKVRAHTNVQEPTVVMGVPDSQSALAHVNQDVDDVDMLDESRVGAAQPVTEPDLLMPSTANGVVPVIHPTKQTSQTAKEKEKAKVKGSTQDSVPKEQTSKGKAVKNKAFQEDEIIDLHKIDYGRITDVKDLPYLDIASKFVQAQVAVPHVSGTRPSRSDPELRSDLSMNTNSYYSSRASWSPEVATAIASVSNVSAQHRPQLITDVSRPESDASMDLDEEYSPMDMITPKPAVAPMTNRHLVYSPPLLDHLSNDEEIYSHQRDVASLPGLSHAYASARMPGKSPHSEIQHIVIDSSDEFDEYEPPAAGTLELTDYEPPDTMLVPSSLKHGLVPKGPKSMQKPSKGQTQSVPQPPTSKKARKKNKLAAQQAAELSEQSHGKKRRKLVASNNAAAVKALFEQNQPLASNDRNLANPAVKQEPESPLRPEMIPLPDTPPSSVANRRRSGYVSEGNARGYASARGIGHRGRPSASDRSALGQVPKPPSALEAVQKMTAAEPREPRVPPPPQPKDALKILAIGSFSGKAYYNRPVRPGDTIPAPDSSIPEIDDTPKTASTPGRAATVFAEPIRQPPPAARPEFEYEREARHSMVSTADASHRYSRDPFSDVDRGAYAIVRSRERVYELEPARAYSSRLPEEPAQYARPTRAPVYYKAAPDDPYYTPREAPVLVERATQPYSPRRPVPEDVPSMRHDDRGYPERRLNHRPSLLESTLRQQHDRYAVPQVESSYPSQYAPLNDRAQSVFVPPPPLANQSRASVMPRPEPPRQYADPGYEQGYGMTAPPPPRPYSAAPIPVYDHRRSEAADRYGSVVPAASAMQYDRAAREDPYARPYERVRTAVPEPYHLRETCPPPEAYPPRPDRETYTARASYVDTPYRPDARILMPPPPSLPPLLSQQYRAGTAVPEHPPPPAQPRPYDGYRAGTAAPSATYPAYNPSALY